MSGKATHSSKVSSPRLFLPKRLGVVLREADLVTKTEIKTALEYQKIYPNMRLGEILAIQGWIKPETVEFFAEEWQQLIEQTYRKPIGHYLQQAALLEAEQIKRVLEEQKHTGYKFGSTAILQGYLKPKTLDFFLKYLFPEELNQSHLRSKKSLAQSRRRQRQLLAQILERKHNPWKK
ncbi:hypothetical protein [Myxosarcina sp. GI1]|uniref:hypothetical protein n=1 Tax=Myxosarcina sp. GI1 TaxID=1541065 RepID=UPI00068A3F25|nr:hypothetical protein [Myxosarcina sp. GI1]